MQHSLGIGLVKKGKLPVRVLEQAAPIRLYIVAVQRDHSRAVHMVVGAEKANGPDVFRAAFFETVWLSVAKNVHVQCVFKNALGQQGFYWKLVITESIH